MPIAKVTNATRFLILTSEEKKKLKKKRKKDMRKPNPNSDVFIKMQQMVGRKT